MTLSSDDDIDALLRLALDAPAPTDGFSDHVMARLPPRGRRTWPSALGVAAGVIACWLSLRHASLVRVGGRDWLSGDISPPAATLIIVAAGLSLLALIWAMAAEDADEPPRRTAASA